MSIDFSLARAKVCRSAFANPGLFPWSNLQSRQNSVANAFSGHDHAIKVSFALSDESAQDTLMAFSALGLQPARSQVFIFQ